MKRILTALLALAMIFSLAASRVSLFTSPRSQRISISIRAAWSLFSSNAAPRFRNQQNTKKWFGKLYPKPPQILRNFRSELTSSCLHPKWDISS